MLIFNPRPSNLESMLRMLVLMHKSGGGLDKRVSHVVILGAKIKTYISYNKKKYRLQSQFANHRICQQESPLQFEFERID